MISGPLIFILPPRRGRGASSWVPSPCRGRATPFQVFSQCLEEAPPLTFPLPMLGRGQGEGGTRLLAASTPPIDNLPFSHSPQRVTS